MSLQRAVFSYPIFYPNNCFLPLFLPRNRFSIIYRKTQRSQYFRYVSLRRFTVVSNCLNNSIPFKSTSEKALKWYRFKAFLLFLAVFYYEIVLLSILAFPTYPYIYPNWTKKRRKTALFRAV